jgi:hypothetical protein
MAEQQPPTIVEGATTGDVDDEIPVAAKSAEDRKAAAALSSLDAPREDESAGTKDVDQEAVRKAMERLGGSASTNGAAAKKDTETKVVKKTVKVDPADVTLLVCLLGRLSVVSLVDFSKAFLQLLPLQLSCLVQRLCRQSSLTAEFCSAPNILVFGPHLPTRNIS